MVIIHSVDHLRKHLQSIKEQGKTIGFFPTMGALHEGHMALLHSSKKYSNYTVCSIFVNPTQFNNPDDLKKYPRTPEADIRVLESEGCDLLFLPEKEDLYSREKKVTFDMQGVDLLFEGASRPGHFEGVARVVKILLEVTGADHAFFGWKDLQQCLVIRKIAEQFQLPVTLHFENTSREKDGLARSSRNLRLNAEQRAAAPAIYEALRFTKENLDKLEISELIRKATQQIEAHPELRIDYFEIADLRNLKPLQKKEKGSLPVALTAVFAGDVRLIDNLLLH